MIQRNLPLGIDYFLRSADLGCHESHYRLGILYKSGGDVEIDIPQGIFFNDKISFLII